jgi:hypothetical protein
MTDPNRPIASYTAEQTARFLSGGELGPPTYHDPETAERWHRHRIAMRHAWASAVSLLADALRPDSPQTGRRLLELWTEAENGNPRARNLLGVMLTELLAQALMPAADSSAPPGTLPGRGHP